MSFWNQADGSADRAHTQSFRIIPEGTKAPAMIKSFVLDETPGFAPAYMVQWKLVDGDYKNQEVRQKIAAFDKDEKKKNRALNMLMRLYKLLSITPPLDAPTNAQLLEFSGKICGIVIREWSGIKDDGKPIEGNWISEVHLADANFKIESGVKAEPVIHKPNSSAFDRNPKGALPVDDSDIPF